MTDIRSTLTLAAKTLKDASDSPELDAELLLAFCLKKPRSHLKAWPEKNLSDTVLTQFQSLLQQRKQGRPIAYLIGSKEFWSLEFTVNEKVLIPRPDTELLVELSLEFIRQTQASRILDLGTGSGILGICLAKECPHLEVIASDLCPQALEIARHNAHQHQAGHIEFLLSNWFEHIPSKPFDLIISNPPYIASNDPHLKQPDLTYEPQHALIAAKQGLADIEILIQTAPQFLSESGCLMLEHGYDQASHVQELFTEHGFKNIQTFHDLANNPRVTQAIYQAR